MMNMKNEAPTGAEIVVEFDNTSQLLASMRVSSPSRLNSSACASDPNMEQLSALGNFKEIDQFSRGKEIVVLLDYDGTLSPIVQDPDQAVMSSSMRNVVKKVAKLYPTAIVTRRSRDKVFNFVQLPELFYAGSHGMEITTPSSGSKFMTRTQGVHLQTATEFLPMIDKIHETLLEKIKSISGAMVENNKFCISVRYRCVECCV